MQEDAAAKVDAPIRAAIERGAKAKGSKAVANHCSTPLALPENSE
jgi:hypothetical protein